METSTLTPHQELFNKLGTGHPQKQMIMLLDRIEAIEKKLEGRFENKVIVEMKDPVQLTAEPVWKEDKPVVKKTRSEAMKEAWAKRKAKV